MRSWFLRHVKLFRQTFMPLFHPRIQRVYGSRKTLLIVVNFIRKKCYRNVSCYLAQCTRFVKVCDKETFPGRLLRWVRCPTICISLDAKSRCSGKADVFDATGFEEPGMSNASHRVTLAPIEFCKRSKGMSTRLTCQAEINPKLFSPTSCKNPGIYC